MRRSTKAVSGVFALMAISAFTPTAYGGAHTWDVVEVFSNADGTIQFVELREMNNTANESSLNGLQVTSQNTGNAFTFPANLVRPTSNKRILLATAGFAALPCAPTPDHIITDNFFAIAGDTVRYHIYDTWVFGAVPTDGVNSLNRVGGSAPNTPTNYDGETGSVNAAVTAGDFNNDGDFDLVDYDQHADCLAGVDAAPDPQNGGVDAQDCLDFFDFDCDQDVDLLDFAEFQTKFGT